MLDTGLPSLDNNAIDIDSPVKRDELPEDTLLTPASVTEGVELDEADVVAATPDDTPVKSEQLSALVDAENVNEEGIKSEEEEQQQEQTENESDGKDESNDEINESIVVNQSAEDAVEELDYMLEKRQELKDIIAKKQMEAMVDSVGDKLSMADADEERFADEVEKMVDEAQSEAERDVENENESDNEETIEEAATQKPSSNQEKHSLREDVSSSDEEDAQDDEKDTDNEKNTNNEGLESEWGGIGIVSLDDKNILTNEIDAYESVPVDLSNDIAINDIMADQGVPINEHAELIDVEKLTRDADVLEKSSSSSSSRLEILADIK